MIVCMSVVNLMRKSMISFEEYEEVGLVNTYGERGVR